jgi:hypothetical protein
MTSDFLDPLLRDAAATYRADATADLDAIYARLERSDALSAASRRRRTVPRWMTAGIGIAATLVIGVGIGRITAPSATAPPVIAPITLPVIVTNAPLQEVTSTYAVQAASLMESLASSAGKTRGAPLGARATELLTTTRLLLDSPAGRDPKMRALLDDLELVLAQIVALPVRPDPVDRSFIADAMAEREVLPRLRELVLVTAPAPY